MEVSVVIGFLPAWQTLEEEDKEEVKAQENAMSAKGRGKEGFLLVLPPSRGLPVLARFNTPLSLPLLTPATQVTVFRP